MVYNAGAEKEISSLIERADKEEPNQAGETLKQALKILKQEFGADHYGDFPIHKEDSPIRGGNSFRVERLRIRNKFYERIIDVYDRIMPKIDETDYEQLERDYELSQKQNEELIGKVERLEGEVKELEGKVDVSNSQIEEFEQAERSLRNV